MTAWRGPVEQLRRPGELEDGVRGLGGGSGRLAGQGRALKAGQILMK